MAPDEGPGILFSTGQSSNDNDNNVAEQKH